MKKSHQKNLIKNEANNGLKNTRGTLAMASYFRAPHSATAQFFINVVDNDFPELLLAKACSWGYSCVFAEVVDAGRDVVDKISCVATGRSATPAKDVIIESVTVSE